ncbi:MAG TPA: hypothetical protein VN812_17735 [Candidatus Acidoferrales bacterium]|nr:hypothetical protein [Candidatus Acidoferrales bacterium]
MNDLNDLRLTNLTAMRVMMTAHGAQDLRHWVTSFGQRLLRLVDQSACGTQNAPKK